MQDHPHLFEATLDSQEILRSHFLQVVCDTVRLPDGKTATRDYIVHPGAVMVVPLLDTPDGLRVVLERQYRYPVRQAMVEFPAGKLDKGEDTLVCGMRELLEETGYTAAEWAHAGVIHPCIAYSTECIDVWFARSLQLDTMRTIGISCSDISDEYMARSVSDIEKKLHEYGYDYLLFCGGYKRDSKEYAVDLLIKKKQRIS